jgi:hypothetical protein
MSEDLDDPTNYRPPTNITDRPFDVIVRVPEEDGSISETRAEVRGKLKRTPTSKFWADIANEAAADRTEKTRDELDRKSREQRENFRPYAWVHNSSIDSDLEIYGEDAPRGKTQSAVEHLRTGGRWWVTETDEREEYTLLLLE